MKSNAFRFYVAQIDHLSAEQIIDQLCMMHYLIKTAKLGILIFYCMQTMGTGRYYFFHLCFIEIIDI